MCWILCTVQYIGKVYNKTGWDKACQPSQSQQAANCYCWLLLLLLWARQFPPLLYVDVPCQKYRRPVYIIDSSNIFVGYIIYIGENLQVFPFHSIGRGRLSHLWQSYIVLGNLYYVEVQHVYIYSKKKGRRCQQQKFAAVFLNIDLGLYSA